MPKNSFVIFTTWKSLSKEMNISPNPLLVKIDEELKLPVLSVCGFAPSHSVGGIIPDPHCQGRLLKNMAKDILSGKKPSDVEPLKSKSVLKINKRKLFERGGSFAALPADVEYYNEEAPAINWSNPFVIVFACLGLIVIATFSFFEFRYRKAMKNSIDRLRNARLSESSARHMLQAVFDASPFAIEVKDADDDFRLIMCNAAFSRMFNKSVSDILGKSDSEIKAELNVNIIREEDLQVLKTGKMYFRILETEFNGIKKVYELKKFPLFLENGKNLVVGVFHDITQTMQTQERLNEAIREARVANRAKSFFLASISHEIRTPLNAVIGFSELLKADGVSLEMQREYAENISIAGTSLLELINDVLDLSKLESGNMEIVAVPTNFRMLCANIMRVFSNSFAQKKLWSKLEVSEMPILLIDEHRVRQIIFNLVGNALKFTTDGGVTLSGHFQQTGSDTGTLYFEVSDTGIGISGEDADKIFQPFIQSSRLRGNKIQRKGTGLGLAICKQMLESMGGKISLQSEVGKGSAFRVKSKMSRLATRLPLKRKVCTTQFPATKSLCEY